MMNLFRAKILFSAFLVMCAVFWVPLSFSFISGVYSYAIHAAPVWAIIQLLILVWHVELAKRIAESEAIARFIDQERSALAASPGSFDDLFRDAKVDLFSKARVRYADGAEWESSFKSVLAWGVLLYLIFAVLSMLEGSPQESLHEQPEIGAENGLNTVNGSSGGQPAFRAVSMLLPVAQVIYLFAQALWIHSKAKAISSSVTIIGAARAVSSEGSRTAEADSE